ncbi:MAG: ribokinase [Planctomycetaceae bacterium]|jgi:ribokinase|nr:ribokinase [Planctomycetaceae bacterium]
MKKGKVIVIGSSNTDMVVKSERIPLPGETVIGGTFLLAPGGKGANQAVAAARLGACVTFVAKVGTDMFGDQAVAGYQKEGIDTGFIFRDAQHATGVALILVDAKGENMISVASGANEYLSPADIESVEATIANADVIVTQLETSLDVLACATRLAKKHAVPLILDPAPAPVTPLPVEILRDITYIKPNKHEAERLTGIQIDNIESAHAAAEQLRGAGVRGVLITLGQGGVLLVEKSGAFCHFPSYRVEAVDTTAAGDAFSGAQAFGLASGKTLPETIELATAVSALSVTRMGAQPSLPTMAEVQEFLLHHKISCSSQVVR